MSQHNPITDEQRELAACYALGVLDGPEAAEFERLLALDEGCRMEVQAFQEVAAELAHGAPFMHPAAHVKEGLFQRVAQIASACAPEVAPAKPNLLRGFDRILKRADEGRWIQTPFPGIELKRLFKDPVTGMLTTLLKAAAGAVYPAHEHGGLEQVYVIDGDMRFDDHMLDTGDYEVSAGETRHSAIRTEEGCLALIIHSPHDKVFPE